MKKFAPISLPLFPPPPPPPGWGGTGSEATTPTDATPLPVCPATPSTAADPYFPRSAMERFLSPATGAADGGVDKYTAGIEVSNACRGWYVWRAARRGEMAARLARPAPPPSGNNKLDSSFANLKESLVSLLDQDLGLMRQLLTLNERIEELKWQHKLRPRAVSRAPPGVGSSSCTCCTSSTSAGCTCYRDSYYSVDTLAGSNGRLDPLEPSMSESRDPWHAKYASPSCLSLVEECEVSNDDFDGGSAEGILGLGERGRAEERISWHQEAAPRSRLSGVSGPSSQSYTLPHSLGASAAHPPKPDPYSGGSLGRSHPPTVALGNADLSSSGKHSLDSGFQETDATHDPNVEMVI